MQRLVLLSLFFLASCVFYCSIATGVESNRLGRHVLFERKTAPTGWEQVRRANAVREHTFYIALVQRNLDVLEKKYWAVSDPDSEEYGNFLSQEEILNIVKPEEKSVNTVLNWLSASGVKKIQNFGDALRVTAPVSIVEKILETKLFLYRNTKTGRKLVRNFGTFSVPAFIRPHIAFVSAVSDFLPDRPAKKVYSATVGASDAIIIPATLQNIYKIPSTLVVTTNASQGPIEFQDDASINLKDVDKFDDQTKIPRQPKPTIVGPFSGEDGESILDYEYITAVGQQAHNYFWTEVDWLYEFAVNFFGTKEVPLVISLSWGWSEADQCSIDNKCKDNSQAYVDRVNAEFQKIGLRGVTILVASGDSGANGRTDPDCSENKLLPDYPACSPYIVSVGATQLASGAATSSSIAPVCKSYSVCAVNGTEQAVSYSAASFTSGGGFSNYASQPVWQQNAVSAYLKSGVKLPPKSYFNTSGRAYPDIAALGNDILIVMGGEPQLTGGTSASAPIVAGVITLLNNYRFQRGLSPIGPFNPLLYKIGDNYPSAFNDVTVGDNVCTEDGCSSSCKGYFCTKGWDPVTGWGSPIYSELLKYITKLDDERIQKRTSNILQ